MNFIATNVHNEGLQYARSKIPQNLHKYLDTDYVLGADPIRLGVHPWVKASLGRTNRDTMHVAYARGTRDKRNCFAIPHLKEVWVEHLIHEYGHVLHDNTGYYASPSSIQPVSRYAHMNYAEAFAEAFTAWVFPHYAKRPDERIIGYFKMLGRY